MVSFKVEKKEIWENICNERNPSPKQDRNSEQEHLETKNNSQTVSREGDSLGTPRTRCNLITLPRTT